MYFQSRDLQNIDVKTTSLYERTWREYDWNFARGSIIFFTSPQIDFPQMCT